MDCKDWMKRIEEDELRWHGKFKARHSYVLLNKMAELRTEMVDLRVPLYILHGEKDAICSLSGSRLLHDTASSSDKTIKVVTDGLHNLLIEKEPIRSQTFKDIWAWVIDRSNNNKNNNKQ
jgi:alpha-beta hydrolase superfamily lysophospholipase